MSGGEPTQSPSASDDVPGASLQAGSSVDPSTDPAAAAYSVYRPTGSLEEGLPGGRHRLWSHLPLPRMRGRVHTLDSFQHREFRLLWSATAFSGAAFFLQQVILGWMTYDLTRSPLLTSIALGLDAFPVLLGGPLGGVLVDNWDRRKLMALLFAYQGVITLGFAVLVFLDMVGVGHIFGYALLVGLGNVIAEPARVSLVPNVVPRRILVNAFALVSMAYSLTRLAAPAIGGVLLAWAGGAGPALLLEAGTLLVGAALAMGMSPVVPTRTGMQLTSALRGLMEGMRYVWSEPNFVGLFLLSMIPSILVMPFVNGLMPVYAAEVFDVGPTGLGLLLSGLGAGATIGTVTLATLGNFKRKGLALLIFGVAVGATMAVFSQNPSYWAAFPLVMVISAGMMMSYTMVSAIVQGAVSDEFRGRVAGLYTLTWGMFPMGSLLAGGLADGLDAPTATLIAAGLVAIALTAVALRFRGIRHVE